MYMQYVPVSFTPFLSSPILPILIIFSHVYEHEQRHAQVLSQRNIVCCFFSTSMCAACIF